MKLHPLSVPLRALSRVGLNELLVGAAAGFFSQSGSAKLLGALFGIVVILVLLAIYEGIYYLRFEYALTEDTLDITSGVVSHRERNVPLRRIQTIDITQGPLARLSSVAAVGLETAGGGETEASLKYVRETEARRLQDELQRLKRGGDADTEESTAESVETDAAPAHGEPKSTATATPGDVLFTLTIGDLLLMSVLRLNLRPLAPLVIAVVAGAQFAPSAVAGVVADDPGLFVLAVVLVTVVAGPVATFARYYDFRLRYAGDELRYERGLLQRYSGSVPIEKIQTLLVRENPLERRFGYATLDLVTAGYADSEESQRVPSAIPLADRDSLMDFARSIEGFDFGTPEFSRPPKRARRRYAGRYTLFVLLATGGLFVLSALTGTRLVVAGVGIVVPQVSVFDYWYAPLALVVLVPVAAHYKWTHRGYAVRDNHVLTRNGFWSRGIEVVPYYRVQTLIHSRSLVQRRLRLGTVEIDTAGSRPNSLAGSHGARAVDFDASEATELRETIRKRLQESLVARRQRPDDSSDVPKEASASEDRDRAG